MFVFVCIDMCLVKTLSKRLSISFIITRNRDFDEEIPSNNFFILLSKFSHLLFRISRWLKIENENSSLECKQDDVEKLLGSVKI